jgi:hypothetical protein
MHSGFGAPYVYIEAYILFKNSLKCLQITRLNKYDSCSPTAPNDTLKSIWCVASVLKFTARQLVNQFRGTGSSFSSWQLLVGQQVLVLWNVEVHHRVHKSTPHVHALFFKTRYNIVIPSVPNHHATPHLGSSPEIFWKKCVCKFSFPHTWSRGII